MLLVAVLIVYAPTCGHDFVDLDDGVYVVENEQVREGLTVSGIRWAFSGLRCWNYQPLTLLSHMVDCSLFGLDARGHHATSVALHAVNTILFFLLLRSTTDQSAASFVAAFLFGLHPLRVEAVAWVASRKDVLCGLFFLLSLLTYSAYARRRDGAVAGNASLPYVAAVLLHGAALLAKPAAVTLPFVLLLLDVWPLNRYQTPSPTGTAQRRLLPEKVPFFAISLVHALLTLAAQRSTMASFESIPLSMRIGNAAVFLGWQVWASLCPIGLAASYPFPRQGYPAHLVELSVIALGACTATCLALRRRVPALPVGWLWFTGMLVPVLGLLQQGDQGVADRWTYLPGLGMAIALAFPAAQAVTTLPRQSGRRLARVTAGLVFGFVAIMLMVASARQVAHWRDAETLWRRTATVYPTSDKALTNLGWALHARGADDEAMRWFAVGLTVNPRHSDCANTLGLLLLDRGRLDDAERYFRLAIDVSPELVAPRSNLGSTLARRGSYPEAKEVFDSALRLDPDDIGALYNYGVMLEAAGDIEAARESLRAVLQLDPGHPQAGRKLLELERAAP
jgi:Tfp pilus assembly protein PilF